MQLRVAWLADCEYSDSYSGREARVLLQSFARNSEILPLWFAVGSLEAPRIWNGVRIFPVPRETFASSNFLETLISQQRPDVLVSTLPCASFSGAFEYLSRKPLRWLHRPCPEELADAKIPVGATILAGEEASCSRFPDTRFVPFIKGFDRNVRDGADSTAVGEAFKKQFFDEATVEKMLGKAVSKTHLIMRQQLFCNTSLAQVMFELTNALIELGVPAIPQNEQEIFADGSYIHCEESLYRAGAPDKYRRIQEHLLDEYNPETSITVHFALVKAAERYSRRATFPSLTRRDVLYATGNHTVMPGQIPLLLDAFEKVLAPSKHVLWPYLQAGLNRRLGAVVPHGIDPSVYSPDAEPMGYPTRKSFLFLQTSFPWLYEKGFDLTIGAFCRAFSKKDDVCLILRVPTVKQVDIRNATFNRLEAMVREAQAKVDAPEILLLESDVELNKRGGIYTGVNCYVHPLRAEGFGMTILEAMACGLPVIATPWSGPADFLSPRWAYTLRHSAPIPEPNQNGNIQRFHVEPEIDHLVHLFRRAYENQEEGKTLGRRAAAVARQDWTWKQAAVKLASEFFLLT